MSVQWPNQYFKERDVVPKHYMYALKTPTSPVCNYNVQNITSYKISIVCQTTFITVWVHSELQSLNQLNIQIIFLFLTDTKLWYS